MSTMSPLFLIHSWLTPWFSMGRNVTLGSLKLHIWVKSSLVMEFRLTTTKSRLSLVGHPPKLSVSYRVFWVSLVIVRGSLRGYAQIAQALTALLKDTFHRSSEVETAFSTLKHALTTVPMLALPDYTLPFTIESDASG